MAVKYHRFYCTVCTKDTFCAFMRTFAKKRKNPKDIEILMLLMTLWQFCCYFLKWNKDKLGSEFICFPEKKEY